MSSKITRLITTLALASGTVTLAAAMFNPPKNGTKCADEGGTCVVKATGDSCRDTSKGKAMTTKRFEVIYGAGDQWRSRYWDAEKRSDNTYTLYKCTTAKSGGMEADPAPGVVE